MSDIGKLISEVGFPMAMCVAFAYALWNMWKDVRKTCETLTNTNAKLVETNEELVKDIKYKLDNVVEKINDLARKQ